MEGSGPAKNLGEMAGACWIHEMRGGSCGYKSDPAVALKFPPSPCHLPYAYDGKCRSRTLFQAPENWSTVARKNHLYPRDPPRRIRNTRPFCVIFMRENTGKLQSRQKEVSQGYNCCGASLLLLIRYRTTGIAAVFYNHPASPDELSTIRFFPSGARAA